MSSEKNFVVDFIARDEAPDEWRMVLVEQGPWSAPYAQHLRRLQARLYDCIDAVLDGQLASKFPETAGKRIVIQVDGYGLPSDAVRSFFASFAAGALANGDYRSAQDACQFASSIGFILNLDD